MHLKDLNNAKAAAEKQAELTQTRIDVEVAGNRGDAQLAEAQRLSKRDVARALGESRSRELLGKGEAAKVAQIGLAEAAVFLQKIRAYGDPRLFALNIAADHFAGSSQPLVPERLLVMGGGGGKSDIGTPSIFSQLMTLMFADKSGLGITETRPAEDLEKLTAQLTRRFEDALANPDTEADLADPTTA